MFRGFRAVLFHPGILRPNSRLAQAALSENRKQWGKGRKIAGGVIKLFGTDFDERQRESSMQIFLAWDDIGVFAFLQEGEESVSSVLFGFTPKDYNRAFVNRKLAPVLI